jgi:hypothetical protein
MERETIIETDFGVMYYYSKKGIVHHIIHKYEHGEPLRNFLLSGTRTLEKHGACKWLSDDRSYAALTKEDVEWGNAVFGPETVRVGWRYWAIVLPKSVVGKISLEYVIKMYADMGLTAQIFTDPDEGMAWLERQRCSK